jgi:hypothetical protein
MSQDEWLKAFASEYRILDPKASTSEAMELAQLSYFPELNPRFAARRRFQVEPLPPRTSEPGVSTRPR